MKLRNVRREQDRELAARDLAQEAIREQERKQRWEAQQRHEAQMRADAKKALEDEVAAMEVTKVRLAADLVRIQNEADNKVAMATAEANKRRAAAVAKEEQVRLLEQQTMAKIEAHAAAINHSATTDAATMVAATALAATAVATTAQPAAAQPAAAQPAAAQPAAAQPAAAPAATATAQAATMEAATMPAATAPAATMPDAPMKKKKPAKNKASMPPGRTTRSAAAKLFNTPSKDHGAVFDLDEALDPDEEMAYGKKGEPLTRRDLQGFAKDRVRMKGTTFEAELAKIAAYSMSAQSFVDMYHFDFVDELQDLDAYASADQYEENE
jgi:hypothetical protein